MKLIKVILGSVAALIIISFYVWGIMQFGKGLHEDGAKRTKRERVEFLRDSLQVEYYKLKIDSLHGK